ncbi:MAG TPA: glycosyltransferase [Rhodopila sp.]
MRPSKGTMNDPATLFPAIEPVRLPPGPPILCIIVDAEEEFHWGRPVSPRNNATSSIRHQNRAHEVFSCYNARPTYLVTYPIASNPSAASVLREYLADGRCDIGAQLHPWVTPPFDSEADERLTFPGNLPPTLERDKLHRLAETVRDSFNLQPTVYKAGRYGLGPSTAALLEEEGFLVDTSLIPRTRYTRVGGPDFSAFDYGPFWFGERQRLLELPVTRALTGLLAERTPTLYAMTDRKLFRPLHAAGLLARARLMERITLSPEGSDLSAMLRLTRALLRRGERIFTFSYHSPSLEPGNTPYVRSHYDLAVFMDRISGFLSFFRDELGGVFLTVRELRDQLQAGMLATHPAPEEPARLAPAVEGTKRCLVVANTFPPVHGGSAIVYDSLARFSGGRVSVLAPREDYRDGRPIEKWRESDRQAPFRVHRLRHLRTLFLPEDAGTWQRIVSLMSDLTIRVSILHRIWKIVRTENIAVVCVGELVSGGWLAGACRRLFGLKTLIYVHGEEISIRTRYDEGGQRRRRALSAADGIVAVSRFTQDTLIRGFNVPQRKIELVSNGVDLARFVPRPRPNDLVARYGLSGRRVLLTVGRLYARKGMDRVIESLPLVLRRFPDLLYLIVGEGSYRPTLEQLVADLGLGRNVIFAGAVPDHRLTDHYSLGDVFIMANREMPDGDTEGFGLVFLEANACGLPVIAGCAGGSVDAVTDQVNGLVVDGNNTTAVAGAIIRIFEDQALRDRLRLGGAEVARAAGWDRRVAQFLNVCDRLTAD